MTRFAKAGFAIAALRGNKLRLEVETNLTGEGSRRYVVRAAERRQKVIQRYFVRQIYDRQPRTPLEPIAMEDVIVANGQVKQIAWLGARRIVIVIFLPGRRYLYEA